MRFFGLALALVLTITAPAVRADGLGSNLRPADRKQPSNIIMVWDGGGSGGHSGVRSGHPAVGRGRQWNWGAGSTHWGQNRQYGASSFYSGPVPTYWVWIPGSAVFDYPFADWRGPTGGWGNP
jgi:hypothetical protein